MQMLMLIMVFVTLMLIISMVIIVPWQLGHRWCCTPTQTRCDKLSSEEHRTPTGTRCIPKEFFDYNDMIVKKPRTRTGTTRDMLSCYPV